MNPGDPRPATGAHFDQFHADYDEALARGLSVSGEDRHYFARGRVAVLAQCLQRLQWTADTILDFGCGTGASSPHLLEILKGRHVTGIDVSVRSLEEARRKHGTEHLRFLELREFEPRGEYSVAFCNGVFHHVPLAERPQMATLLYRAIAPGGYLAFWENNPWNPGARYVMSRIPFDRGAVMISPRKARQLAEAAGFRVVRTDYHFIFPRALRALRFLEPLLSPFPLGAQYQILARRPR